jgi:triphosphoribosyl-dephospho-CoA synthase
VSDEGGQRPCVGRPFRAAEGEALAALRRDLLEAREARQAAIDRLIPADGSMVFLSVGVPGPGKRRPGLVALRRLAAEALERALPVTPPDTGRDAMGQWAACDVPLPAAVVKRATVVLEASLPAGRLVDLDVYDRTGRQVDRASLHLPARQCLVCDRPAVECIRHARHDTADLSAAADRLLIRVLASSLVAGARIELDLTPKPGLVDRLDCGSHPDLSFESMSRSIDLLPAYFGDLLDHLSPLDLAACVEAGVRAERRMTQAIGANTHKGYIFLAGLVLLAAGTGAAPGDLRRQVSALAERILGPRLAQDDPGRSAASSHGARVRADHAVGGIYREALLGLPSVFDVGLPMLAEERTLSDGTRHLLMAVLMQTVEDTTAVHRCGLAGLTRLRSDGLRLQRLIEDGGDYLSWLAALNDDYRRLNLTMGGTADCMALCFGLHDWLDA